jgi:hypothetical protein
LGKLGIHLSTAKSRCKKGIISKKVEKKWQSQFEKLKEYHKSKATAMCLEDGKRTLH